MRRSLLALALMGLAARALADDALDGRAIVEKAERTNKAKDEKVYVKMELISPRGEKRERELTTFMKRAEGDDDKILVRFESPADVKGQALLTVEHGDSDDDQWLYLPEARKVKRIAGATRSQSFAGTDFTHGDMRSEDLTANEYALAGEEAIDGRACYKVDATPKDEDVVDETGYGKRTIFVDKERFTVARIDYYDPKGRPLKVQTLTGWGQVSGYWRSGAAVMEDKQAGSQTRLTYTRRELDKGLADKLFTKRELESPSGD